MGSHEVLCSGSDLIQDMMLSSLVTWSQQVSDHQVFRVHNILVSQTLDTKLLKSRIWIIVQFVSSLLLLVKLKLRLHFVHFDFLQLVRLRTMGQNSDNRLQESIICSKQSFTFHILFGSQLLVFSVLECTMEVRFEDRIPVMINCLLSWSLSFQLTLEYFYFIMSLCSLYIV